MWFTKLAVRWAIRKALDEPYGMWLSGLFFSPSSQDSSAAVAININRIQMVCWSTAVAAGLIAIVYTHSKVTPSLH